MEGAGGNPERDVTRQRYSDPRGAVYKTAAIDRYATTPLKICRRR
jgi:hypothetical protein